MNLAILEISCCRLTRTPPWGLGLHVDSRHTGSRSSAESTIRVSRTHNEPKKLTLLFITLGVWSAVSGDNVFYTIGLLGLGVA